jgi:hypothetical protein
MRACSAIATGVVALNLCGLITANAKPSATPIQMDQAMSVVLFIYGTYS